MKSLAFYTLAVTGAWATTDPNGNANSPVLTSVVLGTGPFPTITQTGCPTVTATRELCTTCAIPACLGLATVTQSCGCPSAIPTVYLDFPCSDNCKGIWCSTSYDIVTATGCTSRTSVKPTGTASTTEPPRNGTSSTRTRTSTSTIVTANAAGRMEVPWARWFI